MRDNPTFPEIKKDLIESVKRTEEYIKQGNKTREEAVIKDNQHRRFIAGNMPNVQCRRRIQQRMQRRDHSDNKGNAAIGF